MTNTNLLILDLYAALKKYEGKEICSFVVLADIEFMLCRSALNHSKTLESAAKKVMMKPDYFKSRLKKLGLWDCRKGEIGVGTTMPRITLPMANG